ncbi:hypothetical protein RRG08_052588 [Elysia crispata]|uniref:Uncharacterized protein n=1 Tax=Elysia crispata TaxID=231223 RepID=A0AAE1A2M1_9GAST|nr:hypothetical protein RRG08_052588 [Elysia crispata]
MFGTFRVSVQIRKSLARIVLGYSVGMLFESVDEVKGSQGMRSSIDEGVYGSQHLTLVKSLSLTARYLRWACITPSTLFLLVSLTARFLRYH